MDMSSQPQSFCRHSCCKSTARQNGGSTRLDAMQFDEIVDNLAHAFLLEKMKREISSIDDIDQLRQCVLALIDLNERQKGMFKQMLYSLIEDDPEAQELFE